MTRFAAAACAVGVVLIGAACAHEAAYEKPLTPVRVEEVEASAASGGVRFSAAILPSHRVDLAFKVPGYIAEIARRPAAGGGSRILQEGDRVRRGQVLARLRPTDFVSKVEQAKSQAAEAAAALEQARLSYERAADLFERKSLTRPEYEAAKGAYEAMTAKVAGATALVGEAENAFGDSSLRSPIDGVIVRRLIEVGSLVGPGTPGFVIVDASTVRVLFGVPDTVFRRLSVNQAVPITTESYPNERFEGRITSLAPAADPGSLVFDVEVTIPNEGDRLKPGMVASVELGAGDPEPVPTVPIAAVVRSTSRPDGYAVFVVEERGDQAHASLRDVTLGSMIGNAVSVTGGLRPGEQVIVSGGTIVTDGEAVEVLR